MKTDTIFYKFTNMTRDEVAEIFSLDNFRGTRFFEDVKAEGKLEAMQGLLALGLGVEQIALALGLVGGSCGGESGSGRSGYS